ncbi:hypothetical protein NFX46_02005 [Streptomyces phaeoluteigriseus]|uniref:Uncharacterized protein n=1 Tax=Streptomyces phaeoluteigriseus TaxID=114686 RepID=A0ABY4Z0X5_9ACTN|nr:hypothetical protein [Streptomyces phaeoluteigriseus]USQ82649.1 hypothetical protein NFX46_02005 [Streptomyces phaeoluteigriseus]
MTEPRTVVVPLLVVQPLEIPEPNWCAGHPAIDSDEARAEFRTDIDHTGPEHHFDFRGERLWTAMLTQAPHSSDPHLRVFVEQGNYARSLDPVGLYDLAATLDAHADRLREIADQLAVILDGEDR